MEDNILQAALKVNEALKNDPRITKLNKLEEKLNNDDQAKILSYKMDMATMRYSDALKIYARDSEEIKPYLQALSHAKEELNSLDIVKEYNHAYQEVKKLYNEINEIVFDDYRYQLDLRKK